MTKRAIVNGETGALSDICDPGDEFDIYSGPDATQKWCDVPDDVTYEHTMINGKIWHRRDLEDKQFTATTERVLAYGPMGEQMDMMYKDQVDGGTVGKIILLRLKQTLLHHHPLMHMIMTPKRSNSMVGWHGKHTMRHMKCLVIV